MYGLTREVRFAVNAGDNDSRPTNTHAGFPTVAGLGRYFSIRLTLSGDVDPATGCVADIKRIDAVVRDRAISTVAAHVRVGSVATGRLMHQLLERLTPGWGDSRLSAVELSVSPYLTLSIFAAEFPMVRLSQKFEFSASHRLHNPSLPDEENRRLFGKCNNPLGHGHNYEVRVTLAGEPDDTGRLIDLPTMERIVGRTVIDRFDHRYLNLECPEFKDTIPSVENIARVIHGLLKSEFGQKLADVTVWETPKTWCEYRE